MAKSGASQNTSRLVEGNVGRSIRSLMFPMMIGMLSLISYNIVDTYFIGQIGTLELAAISFTFPVSFIVGAIVMAFGIGTSAVCARLFGANEKEQVERVATHAIFLGVLVSAAVIAAGILTIEPVFRLLGADETTMPIIKRYMEIYYLGGVFLVIPMIATSVLRAAGNAKVPAMIMTTCALINIVLDPILIFGFAGIPALNVEGAAIATVLSNAGSMVASLYFVCFKYKIIRFRALWLDQMIDSWKRILHVGLPSLASSLITPITTAFITFQIAQFGQEAVAGFGIASRVEGLSLLAIMALSGAVTPFVGQNFGGQRFDRIQAGITWCYRFSLFYGLFVAATMALLCGFIAGLFTDNQQVIAVATMHMLIVPLSYFALGVSIVVNSAFNAIGQPMPAMWVSLSRTVMVYAPLAFVLAQVWGIPGIFIAAFTANIITGVVGYFWLRHAFNKLQMQIETMRSEAAPTEVKAG